MRHNFFRNRESLINSIILFLGIILVLLGIIFLKSTVISTVLISVGSSLIASSVVSFITTYNMMIRIKQNEITEKWGLECITENRGLMNAIINDCFKKKVSQIDIIAYGLKSFRESKDSTIRNQLIKGMSMRIITVKPDSPILNQKDDDENKMPGSTESSIIDLVTWVGEINETINANIRLKCIDKLPTELYFRVDDMVFVGPYELLRESQQTVTYQYRCNTLGGNYYQQYFEQLWEISKEIE